MLAFVERALRKWEENALGSDYMASAVRLTSVYDIMQGRQNTSFGGVKMSQHQQKEGHKKKTKYKIR